MPEEETFEEAIVSMLNQGRFHECMVTVKMEFDSDNLLRNHNYLVDIARKHDIPLDKAMGK